MNRLNFGRLISFLRQEKGWTQEKLAAFAEIDISTLSNIERGAKKHIEPTVLFSLANVFELTTLERREFFLGACGLEQPQLVRPNRPGGGGAGFDAEKTLADACSLLAQMAAPGYLVDVYGNLIASNLLMLELLQFDLAQVPENSNGLPDGYLAFRFLYGILEQQSTFGSGYNNTALTFMRAFREVSLRYRVTPRYRALVKEFRDVQKYPLFERYWRKAASTEIDKESMIDTFEVEHKVYGTLRYLSTSAVTITPYGELYLTHTLPANLSTAEKFVEMSKKIGCDVVRITPWPRQ